MRARFAKALKGIHQSFFEDYLLAKAGPLGHDAYWVSINGQCSQFRALYPVPLQNDEASDVDRGICSGDHADKEGEGESLITGRQRNTT